MKNLNALNKENNSSCKMIVYDTLYTVVTFYIFMHGSNGVRRKT